jgi:hypothetical protein
MTQKAKNQSLTEKHHATVYQQKTDALAYNQTLVGLQYPGREYGLMASYTF